RCPCFGSLYPPLAALTFAAQSIICAFGLAAAAPRSPYRHLELCGIALAAIKKLPLCVKKCQFCHAEDIGANRVRPPTKRSNAFSGKLLT
ncbi:MAG: hypothetical protein SO256_06905, partial [Gemmiger sp.]|uniref:hypothetical protein n=1 Tax=Gemmiger sp. TaxID=2049027 RepID=UPI002A82DE26